MDRTRFDRLTRFLTASGSRRRAVLGLALGAAPVGLRPDESAAGPGCKNVGKKCDKRKECCSGVCRGRKDKKKCRAHDATSCRAGQRSEFCGGFSVDCTTSAGAQGTCETTTGKAGYCAADEAGVCTPCQRDADCRGLLGPAAACVACAGCTATGGVGCATPNAPPP